MDYIYLPDRVVGDEAMYCSRCGEEAPLSRLSRRETPERIMFEIQKHIFCERKAPTHEAI